MPNYKYTAKNRNSETLNGILESKSQAEAEELLHQKGLIIVSLKQTSARAAKEKFSNRVPLDDLVIFSRQLATMIDSGITLIAALEILKEQADNKNLARIISYIYMDVEGGKSFCDAVAKYPQAFSDFYINMIKAGEASGMLDEVLERLALYLEKTASLRRKVISSLTYPAVIITMAGLITMVLMIKVVPTFKNIFESLGGKLPTPTLILIFVSDIMRKYFLIMTAAAVMAVVLLKRYIDTPKGRYKFDKFILKIPIFGDLLMKVAVTRFARTFSTLIKSGIPILNAMEIVGKTAGNKVVEESVKKRPGSSPAGRVNKTAPGKGQGLSSYGGEDDWGGGAGRGIGKDVEQNSGFLRGPGGCRGQRHDQHNRASGNSLLGRSHRRYRLCPVYAHI